MGYPTVLNLIEATSDRRIYSTTISGPETWRQRLAANRAIGKARRVLKSIGSTHVWVQRKGRTPVAVYGDDSTGHTIKSYFIIPSGYITAEGA